MRSYFPKSYLPRSYLPKGYRRFGRQKSGSLMFPCHKFKDPNILVSVYDCVDCPYDMWQDWDGNGLDECYYQWQDDLERLKQLEAEREREKREFEDFLRQNEEQNKVLQETWDREVAQHEALKREIEEREKKEARRKERLRRLGPEEGEAGLQRPLGSHESGEWPDSGEEEGGE